MKTALYGSLALVVLLAAASSCTSILGSFDFSTGGSSASSATASASSAGTGGAKTGTGGMGTGGKGTGGAGTGALGSGATGTGATSSTKASSTSGMGGTGGMGTGGMNTCTQCVAATNCPMPTSDCAQAECTNGCCTMKDLQADAQCGTNGGHRCDGKGNCVACVVDADCPTPTTKCQNAVCTANKCGTSNVASGMTCNDSGGTLCDGNGACVACLSATDCSMTGTVCATPACSAGACSPTHANAGFACSENGGTVCDGNGKCVACVQASDCPPTGTKCAVPACTNNACTPTISMKGLPCNDNGGVVCDGMGKCVSMHCNDMVKDFDETDVDCGGSCTPCINTKGCKVAGDCISGYCTAALTCAACSLDTQCVSGDFCDKANNGGTCTPTNPNGHACSAADQCTSGFCADGVCCNMACNGTCQGCTMALTGSADGFCSTYTGGKTAPAGQCTAAPPCGNDGKCAAGGACEEAPSTTVCGAVSCSGFMLTPTGQCTGTGTCNPGTAAPCPNRFICANGTSCKTSCAVDSDCASSSNYCSNAMCVPKLATGAVCSSGANNSCSSGFCADGVCCNMACNGTCQGCTMAHTGMMDGNCGSYTAGMTAPPGQCPTMSPCGNNGACAAGGTCAQMASGIACGTTCSNGSLTTDQCNGSGMCVSVSAMTCPGAFTCASGTSCLTSCTSDANCLPGHYCSAGNCVPTAANGTACTSVDQCTSGFCVDGYCCNNACNTTMCLSCAVPGWQGTCAVEPDNSDNPNHSCGSGSACCLGTCTSLNQVNDCGACGTVCTSSSKCKIPVCSGSTCATSPATQGIACSDSGGKVCNANGSCVQCNANADCSGATPVCNTVTNTCVQCNFNSDCTGTKNTCCNSVCVDATSDPANCGTCGHGCLGAACTTSMCQPIQLATFSSGTFAPGYGIAVDATNVYWSYDTAAGAIMKVPIGGGPATTLVANLSGPWGVAVNAANVYFTTNGGGQAGFCAIGGCSNTPTWLSTSESSPQGIALDPSYAYWALYVAAPNSKVRDCALGGCSSSPSNLVGGYGDVGYVVTDANNAYWTASTNGSVNKTPLVGKSGSGVVSGLVTGLNNPNLPGGIAVDPTYVYYTMGTALVAKVPILGGLATTLVSGESNVSLIAVDSNYVYWTENALVNGFIKKCALPTCSGGITTIASSQAVPNAITVDNVAVYWVNNQSVMKVAK